MQIEVLDTAGQDEYTPLRETFMHTGDGFLLVYSITDDQTLEDLRQIHLQIQRVDKGRKVSYRLTWSRKYTIKGVAIEFIGTYCISGEQG